MNGFKRYAIYILTVISLLLASYLYISLNKLEKEKRSFERFKERSGSLITLKERWSSNKNRKIIYRRIKSISKPAKDDRKGNLRIMTFTGLTQTSAEKIVKILFDSHFIVHDMDIKRENDKIILYIEVRS